MKESTVAAAAPAQGAPGTRQAPGGLVPPVDIYETKDGLVVAADFAGVEPSGVDVRVEQGVLTLRGTPRDGTSRASVLREWELRAYFRQFELTEEVDQAGIRAELRHGVLYVHLPRRAKGQPRRIEVTVAP